MSAGPGGNTSMPNVRPGCYSVPPLPDGLVYFWASQNKRRGRATQEFTVHFHLNINVILPQMSP